LAYVGIIVTEPPTLIALNVFFLNPFCLSKQQPKHFDQDNAIVFDYHQCAGFNFVLVKSLVDTISFAI
jgi:hypothetical protein